MPAECIGLADDEMAGRSASGDVWKLPLRREVLLGVSSARMAPVVRDVQRPA